jgi:hypothetical protein
VTRPLVLAAILICALVPPSLAQDATIKVINQSKWEIQHMYLSNVADTEWGPDRLGDGVLTSGDSFTLTAIPCASYDVLVVDEDADECIIEAVDLCEDNSFWKITDENLLACESAE